jgi:uncharacterized protein
VKVNIGSILEIRGGIIQFQGLWEVLISDAGLSLKLTKPVAVNGVVTNTGTGFLVQADLSFEYEVNCGRCLERFSASGQVKMQEQYMTRDTLHENDSFLNDDTVYTFTGDVIDLQESIREQVLFALPMSFVCGPNCKGLCVKCGRNLNQQTCNCSRETINPQFEKLRDLLSAKESENKKRIPMFKGGGSDGKSQE